MEADKKYHKGHFLKIHLAASNRCALSEEGSFEHKIAEYTQIQI